MQSVGGLRWGHGQGLWTLSSEGPWMWPEKVKELGFTSSPRELVMSSNHSCHNRVHSWKGERPFGLS